MKTAEEARKEHDEVVKQDIQNNIDQIIEAIQDRIDDPRIDQRLIYSNHIYSGNLLILEDKGYKVKKLGFNNYEISW